MTGEEPADRRSRPTARTVVRVGFVVLLLVSAALFADYTMATAGPAEGAASTPASTETARPDDLTVVSEQTGPLKVFDGEENLVQEYEQYERYWDVDESPVGQRTLLYTATVTASSDACDGEVCKTNVVGRINLTTGAHTELFERTYANRGSNEWHDVDRVNDTHVAVADIGHDRVFFVNVETDEIAWQWNASEHYDASQGGGDLDWTHLNDVEVLPDGSVMVSIRNVDEIVFLRPGFGVDDAWTLGAEDDHEILHAQHNPDYIPPARGGPAVVVADSHNNRIVEYQRVEGSWEKTWAWSDVRAQWTRDGDRLPSGTTLVTDTNGGRVLEVTPDGTVVWSVEATKAYEAERLGTGDESAGGESTTRLRARAAAADSDVAGDWSAAADAGAPSTFSVDAWRTFKASAPPYLLNSLLFVLSPWLDPVQLLPVLIVVVVAVLWAIAEFYWRYWPTIAFRGRQEPR